MNEFDKAYAESIAKDYAFPQKAGSKVVALKKLDSKVRRPALILTWTLGVVATLLLGVGMCLSMNVIGAGTPVTMGVGIAVGLLGIAGVSVNYPLYKKVLKARKEKYANDVIELAKSIME